MIGRQPLPHIRWQQEVLLAIGPNEVEPHTIHNGYIGQQLRHPRTVYATASYVSMASLGPVVDMVMSVRAARAKVCSVARWLAMPSGAVQSRKLR